MNKLEVGIEYLDSTEGFYIRHHAPRRDYGNLKTEYYNDAVSIYNTYGKVYIYFSTGVDSQIITECFLKQDLPFKCVFMHVKGYNDEEYARLDECKLSFGIDIEVLELDLNTVKEEWIERSKLNSVKNMSQYQFGWLAEHLSEPWPVITQGYVEPTLVGKSGKTVSIYRNKYEYAIERFNFINKHRPVIDFPFSPEAIASCITDNAMKGFCRSIQMYATNNFKLNDKVVENADMWDYFAKPILKGQYFKDIRWYRKLTGIEHFPDWFVNTRRVPETSISIPYWDLVDFLENNRNCYKDYKEWHFNL